MKRSVFGGVLETRRIDLEQAICWFLLLLVSTFPLWVAYNHQFALNDDTYITLTYAKSLAAGRGFVFNHPPATFGTTTPFLTLIVAGLSLLLPGVEISRIAVVFTAFCWMGSAWGIYLGREGLGLSRWQSLVVGSVVIASGWVGFLGMEAHLFAFLLVVAVVVYFRESWLLTGVVMGLLFLTRGEGILLLPTLVLYRLVTVWRKERRFSSVLDKGALNILLGCFMMFFVWSLYAWSTFGQILPNTLSAKMAQKAAGYWQPFLSRLVNEWMPMWGRQFALPGYPILNLWWFLLIIGLIYIVIKKSRWLVFVVWISFYIIGYTVLDVAAYWWYQLPVLFVLQMMVAVGLIAVQEYATKFKSGIKFVGHVFSGLLVVVVVFLLAHPIVNAVLYYTGDSRALSYLALADWFNENTAPSKSVAYVEIGYLGYYTENRIIDLMGLVTPDITPYIAKGDFAHGFWMYEPDYFIYLPDFDWALAEIHNDLRFEQNYKVVVALPGPRETNFVIYERSNGFDG